jgi:predicted peptidase
MSLPYRVYYPTGYEKSAEKYPLVLFLHGHGECGKDNKTPLQVFGRNLFLDEIAAMDNCLILAPQTICDGAINKYEWVASGSGRPGEHVWDSSAGGLKIREGELSEITHTIGMQAAEALLFDFIENNRVDTDRIYVGGISMGGCATWEILARNPELFAAAVPLCGSGILSSAASLKDVRIWAFHGTGDKTVWTEGTVKMVDAIRAAGGTKIEYTPITENFGHSIWNPSYTAKNEAGETPAQWLLKQKKGI